MFSEANTTHFTLYVDGLEKDQNANKPVEALKTPTSLAKPTGIISNNNNTDTDSLNAGLTDGLTALTAGVTSSLSGFGSKLTGIGSGLKSLDPFSVLKDANDLKATLNALKNNATAQTPPTRAVDRLQILNITGYEGISTPYAFEITLVNQHIRFDITTLLSKPVFIAFTPDGKTGDGIHGIIQSVKRGPIGQHYATFAIVVTPRFTNLMRRTNQRKFVGKTTPDIIKVILEEHGMMEGAEGGFEFKFKETYPERDFCVQYDESDYQFVSRLCEEEGIAYAFRHNATSHTLVFTDANPYFPTVADAVKFMNDTGLVADSKALKYFDVTLASRTQNATWRDYNFQTMKKPEGNTQGKLSEKANNAQEPTLEHYDYPSSGMDKARNQHLAKVQIERLRADHLLGEGYSDRSDLHAGHTITIQDHPDIETMDAKKPWLITHIKHKAYQPQVLEAFSSTSSTQSTMPSQLAKFLDNDTELEFPVDTQQQGYFNVFTAIPQEIPFRPQHRHPKPQVLGSQTAVVTGATGEEIYCDEYGRIKVQFHWDREGQMDENSSHWIRVASNWAHDGYGTVIIPRVGMEVKVDFLEGDPDNPIVTGAIHNGVNKVPYDLPANKTRSVFKTSSSKGGVGSNELRIEDKAGQEQIFIQSQKDFDQLTKNNHTVQVKNNSHLQVNNEHSETIGKNRYQHQKAEEHHLTDLDRKTQIMMNDHTTVGISSHETIGTIKTTEAGMEINLTAGLQAVIDGGLSLTLKAGGHHIVLNPAGIWMSVPALPGGAPMVGTPVVSMLPMGKSGSVAATSAPTPVQMQTLASDAPFCLECMLNAMGICATDFSNKATPDAVLDANSLSSSLGTPSFAGGLTEGLSSSMSGITGGVNSLTSSMGNLSSMANLPSAGLGGATSGIAGGIANGGIAGGILTGATPSFMGDESNPLSGISESLGSTTNTLQGLAKDPTQAIQQQATKAVTHSAMQAVNSNETLKTASETVQKGTNLANKAKQTQETLNQATTAATSLKTPDISSTMTGFNPNGGGKA